MFDLSTPWWELPVRAAVVYGVLLVLMRLSGKRTVGRLGREQDTSASMVRLLRPQRGDLTLRKPMHSAFFGTPVDLLFSLTPFEPLTAQLARAAETP